MRAALMVAKLPMLPVSAIVAGGVLELAMEKRGDLVAHHG